MLISSRHICIRSIEELLCSYASCCRISFKFFVSKAVQLCERQSVNLSTVRNKWVIPDDKNTSVVRKRLILWACRRIIKFLACGFSFLCHRAQTELSCNVWRATKGAYEIFVELSPAALHSVKSLQTGEIFVIKCTLTTWWLTMEWKSQDHIANRFFKRSSF